MIKCIVIDDEKPGRDELIYHLNRDSDFNVVGEGKNGIEAINLIHEHKPDVVFTDISMPIMNGIELAQELVDRDIEIKLVFVTAYDEHAIKAFELNALDYLLKPLRDERMNQTLLKLKDEVYTPIHKLDTFLNQYTKETSNINLCLYKDGILYPVKQNQVLCVYVEDKVVKIDTLKGQFESYKTLCDLEEILCSKRFFKCHRSFIINLDYVESIEPWFNRTFRVKLETLSKEIPISRTHAQTFKHIMNIL